MIRTFVSIPVPDTPEMDSLRKELRVAGIRPSPPEQTHITLRFICDPRAVKRKICDFLMGFGLCVSTAS